MAEIIAGDGTKEPINLGMSLAELDNDGGTTPVDKEEPNDPSTKAPDDGTKIPEGEDGDGTKSEGEDVDKKDNATNNEPDAEADVDPETFFGEVNKLHGFDLAVEYPEDVDPLSPEGVHIRDKALMEHAIKQFDSHLKETDPRAYAYLLHRQSGGDDSSFFSTQESRLPEYSTFKESVDLQRQVLTADLKSKGLDEDVAKAVIDKAIADKRLFELADKAYQAKETAERQALDKAAQEAEAKEAAETKAINDTVSAITDVVMNSKLDAIVIPDAKRAEFAEYVKQHLYYDGEQFFLTKPVNKDTLAEALQTEYFGFVKGNLSELVERKAKTAVVQKLRLGVAKTKQGPKTSDGKGNTGFVALGDL